MEEPENIPETLTEEFALRQMAGSLLLELDTADGPALMAGTGGGSSFQSNPKIKLAWQYLHDEIHSLVCTKSSKYAFERKALNALTKPVILAFGGLITHEYGIAATTASSIAALALAMPFQLGLNAWCQAYKDALKERTRLEKGTAEYLKGEREQLVQLTQFQRKLDDSDPDERRYALRKLRKYGVLPDIEATLLIRSLSDEDARVRSEAAYALRTLGEPARSAIPALVQALKDGDGEVRRQAAACFRQFSGSESQFLTPLIKALRDPEIDVREEAADSLGRLGSNAQPALKPLRAALAKIGANVERPPGGFSREERLRSLLRGAIMEIERAVDAS